MSRLMEFIKGVENPRENAMDEHPQQHNNNFILYALIDILIYKGIFSIDEWFAAQENAEVCGGILSIEQEVTLLNNLIHRREING